MKKAIAKTICASILLGLIVSAGNAAPFAAPDKKKGTAPETIIIPKEMKSVMEAGLAARQPAKTDIPFTIGEAIIMPGPQEVVYFFLPLKVKNADLGYAPGPAPAVADPAAAVSPAKLQARGHVFVQLFVLENGKVGSLAKEIYVPMTVESEAAGYDPEAVDWYSFGYPFAKGNYLAAVALASEDLSKKGVQYCEITLPNPAGSADKLDTSTILCMKDFQRVETPESQVVVHRGLISWSVARITPNLTKTLKVGEPLDLFFFIYGLRPNDAGAVDVQIDFEVVQGDKSQIKFAPGQFQSPLISLPLPLKNTLQIKTGDKVETREHDLEAGGYSLMIRMLDKASGFKGEKKIDFVIES